MIKGASQCQRPHFPATFRCIAFGRTVVPLFFIVPPIGTLHFLVLKVWALLYTFECSSCSNWETLRVSKDSRGTLLHYLSRFWKFPITKLLAKGHWGELVQWHARSCAAFRIASREDSSRGRICKNTWNYSELCGFTTKLHQWNEIIACLVYGKEHLRSEGAVEECCVSSFCTSIPRMQQNDAASCHEVWFYKEQRQRVLLCCFAILSGVPPGIATQV